MSNPLQRQIRSLANRVRLGVGRGIIRLVSDAAGLQTAQVSLMANETRSNVERMQEYGFTSVPHPGAEAAVVFIGGERGHGLIIAVDDRRYRLKGLEGGEVAIYTDEGDSIILRRGNQIDVQTLTLNIDAAIGVNIETQELYVTGDVRVEGEIIDNFSGDGQSMGDMRAMFNRHTHAETGSQTAIPTQQMEG